MRVHQGVSTTPFPHLFSGCDYSNELTIWTLPVRGHAREKGTRHAGICFCVCAECMNMRNCTSDSNTQSRLPHLEGRPA